MPESRTHARHSDRGAVKEIVPNKLIPKLKPTPPRTSSHLNVTA